MGQYYVPTLSEEDNQLFATLLSHDYDNGLKLMEHAWVGNDFVEVVAQLISSKPLRVAWVGDYADSVISRNDKLLISIFNQSIKKEKRLKMKWDKKERLRVGFLINHSKKQFIDLGRYTKECRLDDWCVNPLSLLTAIGNGQGQGDYYGLNEDKVGIWANDLIEYSTKLPADHEQIYIKFEFNL